MIIFVITQQENMEMTLNKQIPLDKAIELLNKKNEQAKEFNISMSCRYQLVYKNNVIYESSIVFYHEPFNFYEMIEQDMLDMNNGVLNKEMKDFLAFLLPLFPKEEKLVSNKKEKSRKKRNKKLLGTVIGLMAIGLMGVLMVYSLKTFSQTKKSPEQTYDYLIQNNHYIEAAQKYPEKVEDIENLLYEKAVTTREEEVIDLLKQINDQHVTRFGLFDMAIIEANYQSAIAHYETNQNDFDGNQDRLILVGYSYLKENQLEKAKEVSKKLSSVELEKKIFEYTQLSLEIEELEKQLKELEEGGSKNKEKAKEIAENKFQLMEKRVNL